MTEAAIEEKYGIWIHGIMNSDFARNIVNTILEDNGVTQYKWEDNRLYILPNAYYKIRKHDHPYFPLSELEKHLISNLETDVDLLREVKFTN